MITSMFGNYKCSCLYLLCGIICTPGPLGVHKWVVYPGATSWVELRSTAAGYITHGGEPTAFRAPCREGWAPLRRKPGFPPSGGSLGFWRRVSLEYYWVPMSVSGGLQILHFACGRRRGAFVARPWESLSPGFRAGHFSDVTLCNDALVLFPNTFLQPTETFEVGPRCKFCKCNADLRHILRSNRIFLVVNMCKHGSNGKCFQCVVLGCSEFRAGRWIQSEKY